MSIFPANRTALRARFTESSISRIRLIPVSYTHLDVYKRQEEECGMKLFYRDTKRSKVKLTAAGAVMLCEFQKMEVILDGVIDKARRAESGQEGHLTIGLLFGQIFNEITRGVLNHIDENYPKIEIEKLSGGFRDLRTWLDDGSADMVVTYEEEAQLVKNEMCIRDRSKSSCSFS